MAILQVRKKWDRLSLRHLFILKTFGTDKAIELSWNDDIPWKNEEFVIYRLNDQTQVFDSIGLSNNPFYADSGLLNGKFYCYKIKTIGSYASPGIINPIVTGRNLLVIDRLIMFLLVPLS